MLFRSPHAAAIDGSHARSHSAPRTSSRPSRDTRALSPRRPQFEASNKVVPMYSQVHADLDSGASMTMTPHASLISEGQQCNMSIKLADGSVLTSNVKKGFLDATCNGKLLPKIEALQVPDLAATLISSPQLVSEGNMDMVHSKHYGSFMQPACDSCPICTPHVDRIMIATTATDMSISITPYDTHAFLGKSEQALELTSTTRTVTSEHTIELIKLWHARLGGLSFKRLQALAKLHPSVLKIPLQASFNEICHCCQRSSLKEVLPQYLSQKR